MTVEQTTAAPSLRTLDYLPVALFGAVLGLTALSGAWRLAHLRFGVPEWISQVIGALAIIAFVAMACGYATKWASAPDIVRAEFNHPIAGNLFGTILTSMVLLPGVVAPLSLRLAQALWIIGALGMLVFAGLIVDRWLTRRQQVAHAVPAWFIPVVGLLDLPLALPSLGLPPMHGVMVLGLAVGLFFALPLFTLVFSRLLFEGPLPDALQPSLMILVAPFAIGVSAYMVTTGQVDLFAESLYMLMLFMLVVLSGRLRHLASCCPFRVSWWAVSFPLGASAVAALRIATAEPMWATDAIAWLLLAFATGMMLWLTVRTLSGIVKGELRTLSS